MSIEARSRLSEPQVFTAQLVDGPAAHQLHVALDFGSEICKGPINAGLGGRIRGVVRSADEALRLIDQDLPAELRALSRWTFARDLLAVAARTGKKKVLAQAARQLRQALEREGWLLHSIEPRARAGK